MDGEDKVRRPPHASKHVGELSTNMETAKYIAKGKQLTDEYLKSALGHLPLAPKTCLGKQVSMLTIDWDVFAG